ncbi:MAG: ribokinase [Lentisphaeria bacterium]|jgi:ribokinase
MEKSHGAAGVKILNIGSLNIDHVYQVDHIVKPGETIASRALKTVGGGKGANQTLALARAGAAVLHAGKVGADGGWLAQTLAAAGADVRWLQTAAAAATGHAIIQLSTAGENAIVLHGGANRTLTMADLLPALDERAPGDIVLIQNEINLNAEIIAAAAARNLKVCLNPAPFEAQVRDWPLAKVSLLVLNEHEAQGLLGTGQPWSAASIQELHRRLPAAEIIVTQGAHGVLYRSAAEAHWLPAEKVRVVDTTAAGDTFIGYFLACRARALPVAESLRLANRAAGLCVSRLGAMDSIPTWAEVAGPG